MSDSTIRVLLADDHELVRTGLKSLLSKLEDIEVVGEAESGEQAVQLAHELAPDIVLMDVMMPGIGGLEATLKILQRNSKIKVIAVTARDDDPFPARLLRAGALGYLTKDCDIEEMVDTIRKVHAGHRYVSSNIAQQLALKSAADNQEVFASPFEQLSEREMQVMLMITSGQKVAQIAKKLHLSPKTVNSYRYRLFDKLKIMSRSDVELTHLAIRYGILADDQLAPVDEN